MKLRIALLLSLLIGCAGPPVEERPAPDEEVVQLVEWMSGSYENVTRVGQEAEKPPQRMLVMPFGTPASSERWLYAVQWTPGGKRAVRRLIYRLHRAGQQVIAADLFELADPNRLPVVPEQAALDTLTRGDLRRRDGCRIWLSRDGLSYSGGTRGHDCATQYRDASRIRIELVVRENEIVEWLQGFDEQGRRLWGGDAGARVFRRTGS